MENSRCLSPLLFCLELSEIDETIWSYKLRVFNCLSRDSLSAGGTGCNCVIYDWFWDTAGSNAATLNSINYSSAVKTVWLFSSSIEAYFREGAGWDWLLEGMKNSIASHDKRFAVYKAEIPLQFPKLRSLLLRKADFLCLRNFLMQKLCNDFNCSPHGIFLFVGVVSMTFIECFNVHQSPLSRVSSLAYFVEWKSLMGLNFMR